MRRKKKREQDAPQSPAALSSCSRGAAVTWARCVLNSQMRNVHSERKPEHDLQKKTAFIELLFTTMHREMFISN